MAPPGCRLDGGGGYHRSVCLERLLDPSTISRWRGGADNNKIVKFGKQCSNEVQTSIHCVTSLGCTLCGELNMSLHGIRVCTSANYDYFIRKIHNCLSLDIYKLLAHILLTVRLDCGDALLCGVRDSVIRQPGVYTNKLPEWYLGIMEEDCSSRSLRD